MGQSIQNTLSINDISKINSFCQKRPTNYLILSDKQEFKYVDIGKEYSISLKPLLENRRFSLRAKDALDALLSKHVSNHNMIGEYLALKNLGLLFEPELKIDLTSYISKLSSERLLILSGFKFNDHDKVAYHYASNLLNFDLKNIAHIVI